MIHRNDEADTVLSLAGDYFTAMMEANEAELRRIFHPRAYIIGHFDGTLEFSELDEFIGSTVDAKTGNEPFVYRVDEFSQVGDTALVTVTGYCYGAWITDRLSMIKLDDRWQIVNKTFYTYT
ncbi:MAG: hypothetical protein DHS20C01_14310 [marine bacterium B5-7]|nr:MAG: hypothetical protein DHS20C01_14310 [marine bacterium B5-7]